ncbi:AMP-binding protein [Chryseosolibacter indicus]|uniref:AMP-binding protein n=1 Tax=Chryseosolibacter indicus TaxID=2782351 RepID=A0ABS5VP04_9BACT|nr:AMP-binding protein [Chryseosolibacter indicus]MBT1702575.1 AMP-binding protein [Chryseosolibacter indicus]
MQYPYQYIWVNGRSVLLQDIQEGKSTAFTEAERNAFDFIRSWLSDASVFELTTSGSTGTPKKISIKRSQMQTSARLTAQALNLRSNYNALICLDTKFIAGKMMVVRCFELGMKMFFVDPCSNPLVQIPIDRTIDFAALVPYQVTSILGSKHPHLLDTMLTCIIGGAPLDEETKEKIKAFSTSMYITYGMTETISHIALQKINGKEILDYYTTLPDIVINTDSRGCLVIEAPHLEERIITNDIVDIIDSRTFKWVGRWDNVINSGGVKVSAELLEQKIGQIFTRLHINNSFFIYGAEDKNFGSRVILVVEGRFLNIDQESQIVHALLHSFSAYERPKEVYVTSLFLKTKTLKINRQETFKSAELYLKISA